MNLQTVKTDQYYLLVDYDQKAKGGEWELHPEGINYVSQDVVGHNKIVGYRRHSGPKTTGLEGVPELPELPKQEEDVWKVGNKLRVTTIYDWEVRIQGNSEYENKGKQVYEGVVIERDKGLALKTPVAIFNTQGTYWFGSILHQQVELIEAATQQGRYTEDDLLDSIRDAYDRGKIDGINGKDDVDEKYIDDILQSLNPVQGTEWVFEPEIEDVFKVGNVTEFNGQDTFKKMPNPEHPNNPIIVGTWKIK